LILKLGQALVKSRRRYDRLRVLYDQLVQRSLGETSSVIVLDQWFLLSELLSFDYDKTFLNRRIKAPIQGAALAQPDEGVRVTYRKFLGQDYFDTLEVMKGLGKPDHVRVVFCFGD